MAAAEPAPAGAFSTLVSRVRENLQREREVLLRVIYREKRRPIEISPFGKVRVGDEHIYEVYPTSDPDRPRRVLVSVNGKAPEPDERDEAKERRRRPQSRRDREEAERKAAERRQKAQDRFDDVFRVFRFEPHGTDVVDGVECRVIDIRPRQESEPRSDVGKWLKKMRGRACVAEGAGELVDLHMTAVDNILIGWGVVGRVHEGATLTYQRRALPGGSWAPVMLHIAASGRTLLFRSFEVEAVTEWFDYRPAAGAAEGARP